MATRNGYTEGTFCWVDLATTDQAASKTFYSNLLGWTFEDLPTGDGGAYSIANFKGQSAGALYQMSEDMQKAGIPPHWTSYISVENVDGATEKWKSCGGEIIQTPFDAMEAGKMSVVKDPTGGIVALWEAKKAFGAEYVNHPGGFSWNELTTPDPAKAKEFFSKVFNWSYMESPEPMPYSTIKNGEKLNGGIIKMPEEAPAGTPPFWNVYFSVENINTSVETAKTSGGNLIHGPMNVPEVGSFAVIQDPQGAMLTLIQLNQIDD